MDNTDPKRKKLVDTVASQAGLVEAVAESEEGIDNYFLVGTAELALATGHANVRFEVKQGAAGGRRIPRRLYPRCAEKTVRKWHVFSPRRGRQPGETAVAQIRMQYDQAVAYQNQLKQNLRRS